MHILCNKLAELGIQYDLEYSLYGPEFLVAGKLRRKHKRVDVVVINGENIVCAFEVKRSGMPVSHEQLAGYEALLGVPVYPVSGVEGISVATRRAVSHLSKLGEVV